THPEPYAATSRTYYHHSPPLNPPSFPTRRSSDLNALNRRDFMKGMLAAGAVLPVSAAAYYGYQKAQGNPVKVGLIGGGDEGGVLVGEHNPDYLEFVAVADIRPSNLKRIFKGENPPSPRKGFERIYGGKAAGIKKYDDYKKLLE